MAFNRTILIIFVVVLLVLSVVALSVFRQSDAQAAAAAARAAAASVKVVPPPLTTKRAAGNVTTNQKSLFTRHRVGEQFITWHIGEGNGRYANRLNVLIIGMAFAQRHGVRIVPPPLSVAKKCEPLSHGLYDVFDVHSSSHFNHIFAPPSVAENFFVTNSKGDNVVNEDKFTVFEVPLGTPSNSWRETVTVDADVIQLPFTTLWNSHIAAYRVGCFFQLNWVAQLVDALHAPSPLVREAIDGALEFYNRTLLHEAIAVHLRGEDFLTDCRDILSSRLYPASLYFYCYVNDASVVIAEIERVRIKKSQHIFIATNFEHDSSMIVALKRHYGAKMLPMVYPLKHECLRPAVDMELLARSRVFLGNAFSSFSTVVAARRHFVDSHYLQLPVSVPSVLFVGYLAAIGVWLAVKWGSFLKNGARMEKGAAADENHDVPKQVLMALLLRAAVAAALPVLLIQALACYVIPLDVVVWVLTAIQAKKFSSLVWAGLVVVGVCVVSCCVMRAAVAKFK